MGHVSALSFLLSFFVAHIRLNIFSFERLQRGGEGSVGEGGWSSGAGI